MLTSYNIEKRISLKVGTLHPITFGTAAMRAFKLWYFMVMTDTSGKNRVLELKVEKETITDRMNTLSSTRAIICWYPTEKIFKMTWLNQTTEVPEHYLKSVFDICNKLVSTNGSPMIPDHFFDQRFNYGTDDGADLSFGENDMYLSVSYNSISFHQLIGSVKVSSNINELFIEGHSYSYGEDFNSYSFLTDKFSWMNTRNAPTSYELEQLIKKGQVDYDFYNELVNL